MDKQERIQQIIELLYEADELGILAPSLEAELEQLGNSDESFLAEEDEAEDETPLQAYRHIREMRDLQPTYRMLAGEEDEEEDEEA
jgi:maltooligosyltrehalose synthase